MWAVGRQLTDTVVARIFHADLQDLKRIGLDGIISCQSFRVFHPSGLAMSALAECLWTPDVPWEEMRQAYLEAAFGQPAAYADEYLKQTESFLDTGDPHWRTPPLSNANGEKLASCAAFLQTARAGLALRRKATPDKARRRSPDLLTHHARLLHFIVRSYQARLTGETERANRELDRGRVPAADRTTLQYLHRYLVGLAAYGGREARGVEVSMQEQSLPGCDTREASLGRTS